MEELRTLEQTLLLQQILDGQTLREMMSPVYINTDQSTGFAIPFELEYYKSYQKQTKEGDITGYSAKIVFVPAINLAFVVNCNMEGHAASILNPMADILMDGFDSWLRKNQPTNLLPQNYKMLIGDYKDDFGGKSSIYVDQNGPTTQLFITSDLLGISNQPMKVFPSLDNTLQVVPRYNTSSSCFDIETSGTYALITWKLSDKEVIGFTCYGLIYGVTFNKM